jgi:hypothetical protein
MRTILFLLLVTVLIGGSLAGCAARERGGLGDYRGGGDGSFD